MSKSPYDPAILAAARRLLQSSEQYLTAAQAAAYLRIPQTALTRWREDRIGPPWIALPLAYGARHERVRYALTDLNLFMLDCTQEVQKLDLNNIKQRMMISAILSSMNIDWKSWFTSRR